MKLCPKKSIRGQFEDLDNSFVGLNMRLSLDILRE
jgi:hypothetical protein